MSIHVTAKETKGRLSIVIDSNDVVDCWFLQQLMKHGVSVALERGERWTRIKLTSRSSEEAELADIDKMLEDAQP